MAKRSKSTPDKVWKFIHREDEYIKTTILGVSYQDPHGFLIIRTDGLICINASCLQGYAWDGCTPKWELLDFTFGTPDGRFDYITEKPITYFASMVHDILYQFKSEVPISRFDADRLFYIILKESGFIWAGLYYLMVRLVGARYGTWKVKTKVKNLRIVESSWIKNAYDQALKLNINGIEKYDIIKTAIKYLYYEKQ